MINGVAQVNVFGAQKYAVRVQLDPNLLAARGIGIDEVEAALARHNVNLPTGTLWGPHQAFTVQANGQLMNAAQYRPLIVAYRNGSPVRLERAGPRDRQRAERQGGQLVQRHAAPSPSWCSASPAPTRWKWWTASSDLLPAFPRADAAVASNLDIVYDRSESIRESVNDVKFTLAADDRPGGAGDLPVPAQRLRHHHSQPGAAHVHHRHLRRHVPAGLHARQSLADGADALGRVRGGRRHRGAGKHRAAHGNGQDAHGGGARGRRAKSASPFSR